MSHPHANAPAASGSRLLSGQWGPLSVSTDAQAAAQLAPAKLGVSARPPRAVLGQLDPNRATSRLHLNPAAAPGQKAALSQKPASMPAFSIYQDDAENQPPPAPVAARALAPPPVYQRPQQHAEKQQQQPLQDRTQMPEWARNLPPLPSHPSSMSSCSAYSNANSRTTISSQPTSSSPKHSLTITPFSIYCDQSPSLLPTPTAAVTRPPPPSYQTAVTSSSLVYMPEPEQSLQLQLPPPSRPAPVWPQPPVFAAAAAAENVTAPSKFAVYADPAAESAAAAIAKAPPALRSPLRTLQITQPLNHRSSHENSVLSSSADSSCASDSSLSAENSPAAAAATSASTSRISEAEAEMAVADDSASVQSASVSPEPPTAELESSLNLEDDYSEDIYKHLREIEGKYLAKLNYMSKQPDITYAMRSILVDWLVEVSEEYKMQTETVFLATNLIDRFLSHMSVQRAKLQLVGAACIFIAAKYEEIYPPDVNEFTYITDDTYSKKQVLRMEQLVLQVLNFEVAIPTTHLFVTRFCEQGNCSDPVAYLAQYLSELTLMDAETYLHYYPSHLAASCVCLARHTLGYAAWPEKMVQLTTFRLEALRDCLVKVHETFTKAPELQQQAIREKYRDNTRFQKISETLPTPIF